MEHRSIVDDSLYNNSENRKAIHEEKTGQGEIKRKEKKER